MKIFLTGGTGFIGSHLINEIHSRGYEILAIRRKGSKPRIKLDKEPVWVEGGLDGNFSKELIQCDFFIHLATYGSSPQPANWSDCFFWNVLKSTELLRDTLNAGIKKIISVGTYAEYGDHALKYEYIPPDCPLSPQGPYATSKAAFGLAMRSLCKEYNVYGIYYRLFSIYGEGQFEKNFYPSLKKAAISGNDFLMTKGEQIRDFISVEKTVKQICDGLNFNNVIAGNTKILNIGSGKPQTILKFAQDNWLKWKAKGDLKIGAIPYREKETMRYVAKI